MGPRHSSGEPGGGCSACRTTGAGLGSEGLRGDCDAGSEGEGECRGSDELGHVDEGREEDHGVPHPHHED
eukprot:12256441-Heterocapsa_arctica.AAC.1